MLPFRRIYVLAVAVQHKTFIIHKYLRGCLALIEVSLSLMHMGVRAFNTHTPTLDTTP